MADPRERVLLYNPKANFYTQPLGSIAVAAALDSARFDVTFWDGRLVDGDKGLEAWDQDTPPLCLGVSVLSGPPIEDALAFTRTFKKRFPQVPVVWGGWHPSIFPEQCVEDPSIDIACVGQGQVTFREVCDALQKGRPVAGIPGTVVCTETGEIVRGPERPLEPLENLPVPSYSLLDMETYYAMNGRRALDYVSSQGCPFRCAFCADPQVFKRQWIALTAEEVLEQIRTLRAQTHFDEVAFQDDLFFVERKRVIEIAQGLSEMSPPLTWVATSRAQHIVGMKPEYMALMKKSGLRRVVIGAESGSDLHLKSLNKDQRVDMIIGAAEKLAEYDIDVTMSFIVGSPNETEEERRETVELIMKVKELHPAAETPISLFAPYPGSELVNDLQADAEMMAKLPNTLEEWSRCDFYSSEVTSMTNGQRQWYRRLDYYLKHLGQPRGGRMEHKILHLLSKIRCKNGRMDMPVEWMVSRVLERGRHWVGSRTVSRPLSML